ncbi:MAG: cupin domain-containing protein [Candidatus Lokiarchaeota archaeon]|nr:cupin domain-containing protein [Candidatus Lokiarchaeota archaeon]
MKVINENDIEYRDGDSGAKYLIRGPLLDWGLILYKPGQSLGEHYHEKTEETFYILEGTPTFVINGKKMKMKSGDAFRLDMKVKHNILNESKENCKILFIKTPYYPEDKVSV